MERRAHVMAGAAAGLAAAYLLGYRPVEAALAMWAAAASSTLPDLDLRRGHRVLLHNLCAALLLGVAVAAAVAAPVSPLPGALLGPLVAGVEAGYLSHLLLDALTVSGVAIFYPCSRRRLRLARLRSDSRLANIAVEAASLAAVLAAGWGVALRG